MTIEATLHVALLSLIFLGVAYFVGTWSRAVVPTVVGYLIHWCTAFGAFAVAGLLFPDAVLYDAIAMGGQQDEALPLGKEGWTVLLAGLYRLFGHAPAIGLVVNVLAASITVAVIAVIARYLRLPPRRSAWIAALWPSGILWSSLLLRESITWMFLTLCALGFAGLATGRSPRVHGVVLGVSIVGLFEFRGTAAVIVGVVGAIAVLVIRKGYLTLAGGAAVTILLVLSPVGGPIRDIIAQYDLERILFSRQWLSDNATTGFPVDNLWDVFVRVLVGPLPWEWGLVGPIFALDGVVWLVVLALATRGWWNSEHKRLLLILILPAVVLWVSLAVNSGNYGTMQRLRALPEILLLPLAAAGSIWSRQPQLAPPWDLSGTGAGLTAVPRRRTVAASAPAFAHPTRPRS